MENIRFDKGIYTAGVDSKKPEGFYSDALNIREDGIIRQTDEGTVITGVPTLLVIWGSTTIASDTIIIGQLDSRTIIGALNVDNTWTVLSHRTVDTIQATSPLQVTGRKNWAGERLIYFSTNNGARRMNLDKEFPTNDEEFDKITSLFLEYDLPKAVYSGESTSGSLSTGVYQFAIRLVTDSEAATPFGIPTGVVSVTKGSTSTSRSDTTGDQPQTPTNKAIELQINNVDSAFMYIQIGILTYIGLANTPVVSVTNLIPINSRVNISYTYTGDSDHLTQISLNEFIASGVNYDTGKFFTQTGGTLLIGAPTETDTPNIDWHRVAENITSKYVVKKISYKENLEFDVYREDTSGLKRQKVVETSYDPMDDSYKNPLTVERFKSHRRGEVYAFTLTPVFKSGVLGPTVHIPAQIANTNPTTEPNIDDGGLLGCFESQEQYPDDRYPNIAAGQGLRFHKFPDAVQQPIVSGSVDSNDLFIRVLGVKFENIVLDSTESEFEDLIKGYIIGRVNRKGNESQLAQGIVRPTQQILYDDDVNYVKSSAIGDGFADWLIDTDAGDTASTSNPTSNDYSSFGFIAPDIIHNLYDLDNASYIYQHSAYRCNPYAALTNGPSGLGRLSLGTSNIAFKNITGEKDPAFTINQSKSLLAGSRVDVRPFGLPLQPGSKGGKENTTIIKGIDSIRMASSDGFSWLNTADGSSIQFDKTDEHFYKIYQKVSNNGPYQHGINFAGDTGTPSYTAIPALSTTRPSFVVHSLYRDVLKPYGSLDQIVSMQAHFEEWGSSECEFFNGDTFINKYGLSLNDEGFYPYNTLDTDGNDSYNKSGFTKPPNMSMIVYMWIESSNNYAFRHYVEPVSFSADSVVSSGSVPFFPAYKILANYEIPFGMLTMSGDAFKRLGYASQYNNQYSAQPNAKPFAITPKEDLERKAELKNRILYSVESVQGEKADGYQIFLPNNYYDLPSEHGYMTDIYMNKELYASTPETQWLLFYNTLATQATSIGEVVLGTGGAFNRPAVPLSTVGGGFGGTSHWMHAVNTPNGRFFVDKKQGLIFQSQDGLKPISNFLSDDYKSSIPLLLNDGIRIGSEPKRSRVFIRLGDEVYSFSTASGLFISRHDYIPRWMSSHGPNMFSQKELNSIGNDGVFLHSEGSNGMFYDIQRQSYITLVVNMAPHKSKGFKAIELVTSVTGSTGLNEAFNTFDALEIWNQEQYTGLIDMTVKSNVFQPEGIMEVLVSRVRNNFRLSIPRNIVANPNLSIFDTSNHLQLKTDTVKAKWLDKIRGNFVHIKLINNNNESTLKLENACVIISENNR